MRPTQLQHVQRLYVINHPKLHQHWGAPARCRAGAILSSLQSDARPGEVLELMIVRHMCVIAARFVAALPTTPIRCSH